MTEFELIGTYFEQQVVSRKDVIVGIGDDCAILKASDNKHIAVTTDTLVEGVHFPKNTSARAIGYKSVAVSLSDLAAAGAEPAWISLALTLPEADTDWVAEFSASIFELCEYYNVQLIGGDTTQGPLSITVTAQGLLPAGKHLTRAGAKAGDWLYVTGEIGGAALALQAIQQKASVDSSQLDAIRNQLDFPKPRVLAGQILRDYASAAIDVSDGLLADLNHICERSQVGALVNIEKLPIPTVLFDSLEKDQAIALALTGGDDYELLFTVSEDNRVGMETALNHAGVAYHCIGRINGSKKITLNDQGQPYTLNNLIGFEHFRHAG
jgi:thiamine-monophosphate kinase